jgi:peptidoglycan/LPS O-acetylase OafA/YrhL
MSLSGWDDTFRKVVVFRLDAILYGVLAAYFKHEFLLIWRQIAWPAFVVGVLGLLGLHWFFLNTLNFDVVHPFLRLWYFPFTSIAVMLLLPWADAWTNAKGTLPKVITHISLVSYSMYLVNFYLILQKLNRLRSSFPSNFAWSITFLISYLLLVVCLATILYGFVEKPIMDKRKSENLA